MCVLKSQLFACLGVGFLFGGVLLVGLLIGVFIYLFYNSFKTLLSTVTPKIFINSKVPLAYQQDLPEIFINSKIPLAYQQNLPKIIFINSKVQLEW